MLKASVATGILPAWDQPSKVAHSYPSPGRDRCEPLRLAGVDIFHQPFRQARRVIGVGDDANPVASSGNQGLTDLPAGQRKRPRLPYLPSPCHLMSAPSSGRMVFGPRGQICQRHGGRGPNSGRIGTRSGQPPGNPAETSMFIRAISPSAMWLTRSSSGQPPAGRAGSANTAKYEPTAGRPQTAARASSVSRRHCCAPRRPLPLQYARTCWNIGLVTVRGDPGDRGRSLASASSIVRPQDENHRGRGPREHAVRRRKGSLPLGASPLADFWSMRPRIGTCGLRAAPP